MKRKTIIIVAAVVCFVLAVTVIYVNRDIVVYRIFKLISRRLDYERSLEVGDDFAVQSWGDLTFNINHYKSGYNLEYEKLADREIYVLLTSVYGYRIVDNRLYIASEDGCAVIDENNFCRIFLIVPDEEFIDGYTKDSFGNKVYNLRKFEMPNIKYLSSYDQFDEAERKIIDKL